MYICNYGNEVCRWKNENQGGREVNSFFFLPNISRFPRMRLISYLYKIQHT